MITYAQDHPILLCVCVWLQYLLMLLIISYCMSPKSSTNTKGWNGNPQNFLEQSRRSKDDSLLGSCTQLGHSYCCKSWSTKTFLLNLLYLVKFIPKPLGSIHFVLTECHWSAIFAGSCGYTETPRTHSRQNDWRFWISYFWVFYYEITS